MPSVVVGGGGGGSRVSSVGGKEAKHKDKTDGPIDVCLLVLVMPHSAPLVFCVFSRGFSYGVGAGVMGV